MKNYLLPLFLLFFLSTTIAQIEFAPPGATWHYTYVDRDIRGVVYLDGYQKTTYKGDTLIDNQNCKILEITNSGSIDGELVTYQRDDRFIYQEGYELFAYQYGAFKKLYDFSLEKGDTLEIEPNQAPCIITVDSVYFVNINGEDIKHFVLNSDFNGQWLMNEKMGMLNYGMFTPEFSCYFDATFVGELRCYEDDDFSLYQLGNTACDSYDDVSAILDLQELGLSFFPNPVQDFIQLKNEENIAYQLSIYNGSGQLFHQSPNEETLQKTIDSSTWPNGMYFMVVQTEKGNAVGKILKME